MMSEQERERMNRLAAKKYFKGAGIWPWLLIGFGFPLCFIVIGFFMIIVGIVWILVVSFSSAEFEQEVDQIVASEQKYLLHRGTEKLNIVEEQMQLIDPINTVGMSYQPILESEGKASSWSKLKRSTQANAPKLVSRIGKDDRWRFSLIQVNIFLFGESQLFIYFAHLDVTTGMIYHEGTVELFYKDISGITSEQKLESKYNINKKRYQNITLESINIYSAGCEHKAGFDTSMTGAVLDKHFAAMRNLIREKKE